MNSGVSGVSYSSDGAGVYGSDNAAGCTTGDGGCFGVFGTSDVGNAVWGQTQNGVALYGRASVNGVGLRVEGQQDGNLIEAWHGPLSPDREFYVSSVGNVYADGDYFSPAFGFAQMLPGAAGLEVGDVLVIGPDGRLTRCTAAYESTVVGVYSPQAGFVGGAVEHTAGQVPLAVMGVVPVKASAENGPIAPGDLLAASYTPGHAMKATPLTVSGTTLYPTGVVIGKALEGLDEGTSIILMLVMLH